MPDLDRMTKPEIWAAGLAAGRLEALAEKPGYLTSEFWITGVTLIFAIWVGSRLIMDPSIDLERGGAIVALVVAAAWKYQDVRKVVKTEGSKPNA